ncbi:hypothetical protein MPH_02868 [Macrophomina phaseolina MS6]|uniref:Uncharacterized protein n=1 Tax=Macrophomina phaseolina (strain MS6) TaxID=1126212 RepID=K2SBL9_MACPH|nr:hypothetical protein MPH_02868 [Macrophomina phaseolina MS6]
MAVLDYYCCHSFHGLTVAHGKGTIGDYSFLRPLPCGLTSARRIVPPSTLTHTFKLLYIILNIGQCDCWKMRLRQRKNRPNGSILLTAFPADLRRRCLGKLQCISRTKSPRLQELYDPSSLCVISALKPGHFKWRPYTTDLSLRKAYKSRWARELDRRGWGSDATGPGNIMEISLIGPCLICETCRTLFWVE